MLVIGLLNEKGGVGKTTAAVHLAAGLAIRGQRVLLIDADAQGNASRTLGQKEEPCFYDLLVRDGEWSSLLRYPARENFAGSYDVRGTLAVLPSNHETRGVADKTDDFPLLKTRIDELEGVVDVVVIDTSPGPTLMHNMIYIASDAILLPTSAEYLSMVGVGRSMTRPMKYAPLREAMGAAPTEVLGIVPTMVRAGTLEHRENLISLHKQFGDKVWSAISLSTMWAEASRRHRTLFAYAPNSAAEAQAWGLVDALAVKHG